MTARVRFPLGPGRVPLGCLVFISGMTMFSCRTVDNLKPQFGVIAVAGEDGRQFYFKREVRGLSYDVLAISLDPNPCSSANSTTDYVFTAQGPHTVYYRIDAGKLRVFSAPPVKVPETPQGDFVEAHLLEAPDFLELRDDYERRGLTKVDVPLNVPDRTCLQH